MPPSAPLAGSLGVVGAAAGVDSSLRAHRQVKRITAAWLERLEGRIPSAAPSGVRVRPPRAGIAYVAVMVTKFLTFVAVLLALVIAAAMVL